MYLFKRRFFGTDELHVLFTRLIELEPDSRQHNVNKIVWNYLSGSGISMLKTPWRVASVTRESK